MMAAVIPSAPSVAPTANKSRPSSRGRNIVDPSEPGFGDENAATTKIQAVWRGRSTRKELMQQKTVASKALTIPGPVAPPSARIARPPSRGRNIVYPSELSSDPQVAPNSEPVVDGRAAATKIQAVRKENAKC